ncbi:hypothetical protein MUK71_09900 [Arthrobacter zhangbolii]|uniref:Uncharacterized protein n=1 Tax=Arthrobacter zhangbolii TaxID=2886936 RepID=A0A9X1M5I0_9MICC|nr:MULTISPECIES: hypothetical protein [Arthrobacter]MCC3271265.1 hypothetical protein [Arthrobacter zhangbolii]MDN3904334.1 hypothetical protein [Arthrobacter sp. YD2]UON90948.1 hypothetical protein MUK71_09900 [Arthrobacter zhangbolii]
MTNGPESAEAPRRSRRAADAPVDSPAGPRERESQQRARDREALRAYKALAETPERSDSGTAPPTRRQLRLQQQQRAAAANTRSSAPAALGGNDAVAPVPEATSVPEPSKPAAAATSADAAPLRRERRRQPAADAAREQASEGRTRAETGPDASARGGSAQEAVSAKPVHAGEKTDSPKTPGKPAHGVESRRRARNAGAGSAAPAADGPETESPAAPTAEAQTPEAQTPEAQTPEAQTRSAREGKGRPGTAKPAKGAAGGETAGDPNADIAGMTVEQALAAREALEGQARNQIAAMEAMQADDPHAVDLELLAQQKALAERAKVLNRRTEAMQKLSRENEERRPSSNDPSTAHNLAMVTPLEFVKVPGMEHPVMKAPPTSHVPIVTSSTPKADAPPARSLPVVPGKAPTRQPAGAPRRTADAADVRHSRILARADALVNPPLASEEAARPVGARNAFGLDPLDVMTAGLGRTRKLRFAVFGVAGLGTLALIVGVLMIVGGLGG